MRLSVFMAESQTLIETLTSQGFTSTVMPKVKNHEEKTVSYRVILSKTVKESTIQCELILTVYASTKQNTFEMRIESSAHNGLISMAKLADLQQKTVPFSERLGQCRGGRVSVALRKQLSIYEKLLPVVQGSLDGREWQPVYYGTQDF